MEWKGINFDWNHAKNFLVTAEEGSFSSAAQALGVSQPTLSRQVSALEDDLGVALFERSSKGLSLTVNGLELVEYVREMARLASQFSLSATGRSEEVEGTVVISASDVIAMHVMPDIIKGLSEHEPTIDIELISTDKNSDLHGREADIAIRAARPAQPELIARKLRNARGRLYASTDYINKLGRPLSVHKLREANYVGFATDSPYMPLLEQQLGARPERSPIVVDSSLVQWEYVRQGMGIGFMLEDVAEQDPLVELVLPENPPLVYEIWLVVHRELRSSKRLQIVFDYLANKLSD